MKVLAIETATAVCAAAVASEEGIIAEVSLHEEYIHSEKLMTIVDAVLSESRPTSGKEGGYDAVAISIGPGSFTGLRIGLSVAKGLTAAEGKPLVAVSTLEALAWRAVKENIAVDDDEIIAMIDARRDDAYCASFSVSKNKLTKHWGPEALSLDIVADRLSRTKRVVCMGDAVEKFLRRDSTLANVRLVVPPVPQRLCSAGAVGLIGVRKALQGDFSEPSSLEPVYVKEFVSLVERQHITTS